jgi:hypothetical protein
MRKLRRKHGVAARGWRFAAALLAMLTFAVQSYVTQTHIHFDAPVSSDGIAKAAPNAPQGKLPFKETPANCPICQEIAMAGHYVTPGAVALVLPSQTVSIVPIDVSVPFIVEAVSHDWHGRAPPKA